MDNGLIGKVCSTRHDRLFLSTFFCSFFLSFSFYGNMPWILAMTAALCLGVVSASIQIFNDYRDREHDTMKGKNFASQNAALLFDFWLLISFLAIVPLIYVSRISPKIGIFCIIIWGLGILYSFLQKLFVAQNIIVAVCASLPALCGHVHYGEPSLKDRSFFLFILLFAIIFVREVIKDIQDRKVDGGYKHTLPVMTAHHTKPEDIYKFRKPPLPFTTKISIEELFPGFRPEIFSTFEIISLVIGWSSLACLGLGGTGVPTFFMMMGILLTFQFVLRNPDRFVLWAKNSIDATIIILFASLYIDNFF